MNINKKIVITLSAVAVTIVAAVLLLIFYANSILTHLASEELQERFADMDSVQVAYSDLQIDLKQGAVSLKDFSYSIDTLKYPDLPRVTVTCHLLKTDHINWLGVARNQRLHLQELLIDGLQVQVERDSVQKNISLDRLQEKMSEVDIRQIHLTNSGVCLTQKGSAFQVLVPEVELHTGRIGYNIKKLSLTHCDDITLRLADGLQITMPDSLTMITATSLVVDDSTVVAGLRFNNDDKANTTVACPLITIAPLNLKQIVQHKVIDLPYLHFIDGNICFRNANSQLLLQKCNLHLGQIQYDLNSKRLLRFDPQYSIALDSLHFRSKQTIISVKKVLSQDSCIVAEQVSYTSKSKKEQHVSCSQIQLPLPQPMQIMESKTIDLPFLSVKHLSANVIVNEKTEHINTGEGQWVEALETDKRITNYRAQREAAAKQNGQALARVTQPFVSNIIIQNLACVDASLAVTNPASHYSLSLPRVGCSLEDIKYDVAEQSLSISQTNYSISANGLDMLSSDGLYRLKIDHAQTANAGSIFVWGIHGCNTVEKETFAEHKGNVPVTWSEVNIRYLHTSAVSLVRLIQSKQIQLDSVFVEAESLAIYRDTRYPPQSPYPMPQEVLSKFSKPIHISNVHLTSPSFEAQLRRKEGGVGTVALRDISMYATNLSNKEGDSFHCLLTHRIGGGTSKIHFTLNNDKQSSFAVTADITSLHGSDFQAVTRPMLGLTADCHISSFVATVNGNKEATKGDMCMQYDGLKVHFIKDEVPIEKVKKYAGLINTFAPMFLHKSNPKNKHAEASITPLGIEHDTQKNFAAYLITTLLDGMLRTTMSDFAYNKVKNVNQ